MLVTCATLALVYVLFITTMIMMNIITTRFRDLRRQQGRRLILSWCMHSFTSITYYHVVRC